MARTLGDHYKVHVLAAFSNLFHGKSQVAVEFVIGGFSMPIEVSKLLAWASIGSKNSNQAKP